MPEKVRCNICNKDITYKNLKRHQNSRVHKQNDTIIVLSSKKEKKQ